MKAYPLEIETERDEGTGPVLGVWSKGHHDPEAFALAARQAGWGAVASEVQQHYMRKVPAERGRGFCWLVPSRPGRGAFPCTSYTFPF